MLKVALVRITDSYLSNRYLATSGPTFTGALRRVAAVPGPAQRRAEEVVSGTSTQ